MPNHKVGEEEMGCSVQFRKQRGKSETNWFRGTKAENAGQSASWDTDDKISGQLANMEIYPQPKVQIAVMHPVAYELERVVFPSCRRARTLCHHQSHHL